jgi:hypothetical protein
MLSCTTPSRRQSTTASQRGLLIPRSLIRSAASTSLTMGQSRRHVLGTTSLPLTSLVLVLLRPSSTPPHSSSSAAPIRYTYCFMLMTLWSPHLAQRSCSTLYLLSSRNSAWKTLTLFTTFWGGLCIASDRLSLPHLSLVHPRRP